MDKAQMIGLRSHSFRVGRLTVQTDHDTRASKIYTGETETYLEHRVSIRDKLFFHIHDPLLVTTLLIMRHRWRDLSIVDRGIDRSEHDFDDKICAEGRLCLTEGGGVHHVLQSALSG
jgi:hypothetical protein